VRSLRGCHGLVHLGGSPERHAADHGAGGRIHHVQEASASGDGLPVDPVVDVRVRARGSTILGGGGGSNIKGGHGFTPVG
jgi:hypothetical protein